jgi:hypothetical protein
MYPRWVIALSLRRYYRFVNYRFHLITACEQVIDLRDVRAGMWSQHAIFRHDFFVTVNNFAEFPNGKLVHIRRLSILTSRWHDPCPSELQKENEMNSIELILLGLFLVAILLMQ